MSLHRIGFQDNQRSFHRILLYPPEAFGGASTVEARPGAVKGQWASKKNMPVVPNNWACILLQNP
jgi:hypothetical protein